MDTTLNGQPYDETDQQGEEAHVLEDQPDQLSAGGMHDDGRRPVSFYSQRRLRGGDHPRQEHEGPYTRPAPNRTAGAPPAPGGQMSCGKQP